MKIAISGSSGFVGQSLTKHYLEQGDSVIGIKIRESMSAETLSKIVEGCDVLINLSGANILSRWSQRYKKQLYSSRIETTDLIVNALVLCENPPKTFLSASAVGIYDSEGTHDESSTAFAGDFLSTLCQQWEAKAYEASSEAVRVCMMRFGIIFGKEGGAITKMVAPFRFGLGGRLGSGTQKLSWIHIEDLVAAMNHLIVHKELEGVFNLTAPGIVTNLEQTSALAKALHRPAFLTVPEFAIKLLLGEGASVLLESRAARPGRLLDSGFSFRYPTLDTALREIVNDR